jgi:hypothetical protein
MDVGQTVELVTALTTIACLLLLRPSRRSLVAARATDRRRRGGRLD